MAKYLGCSCHRFLGAVLSVAALAGLTAGCKQTTKLPDPDVPEAEWCYARVVSDPADLIGGPLALGELGDVLIGNARVRFIIQGHENPRSLLPYGGTLIDADIVRPDGEPGQDHLGELATIAGYVRFVKPDTIEVVNDGQGGWPAVVRVTGMDAGMPLIDSLLPLDPAEVLVQIDYILEPEAESLVIETTYIAMGTGGAQSVKPGDGLFVGDMVVRCAAPEPGCDDDASGRTELLGAYAAGKVSYGYFLAEEDMRVELNIDELMLITATGVSLHPGESASFRRYFAVGDGDLTSVRAEALRRYGVTDVVTIGGQVGLEGGNPGAGAQVDVHNMDGDWVTRAVAGADGAFLITVAPDSYELTARLPAREQTAPEIVDVSNDSVSDVALTLAAPAVVVVDVRDDQGVPVPARVMFLAGTDPPLGQGDTETLWSKDGGGEIVLPPGDYVAAVTRGYEYDYDWVHFQAVAGETVTVQASLSRVVDTTGYIAMDSHTHTRFSMDSQLWEVDRVAQAAAEHVELVITTEHDYISDLTPVIHDEGAEDWVIAEKGVEISPLPAHTNAYPVSGDNAHRDGYWPVAWHETDEDGETIGIRPMTAIFADIRDALGALIIQLNHPRDTGMGVLDHVGYDPATGFGPDGVEPEVMDTNFNAIEICNSGWGEGDLEALEDWYSFLNQGLPVVAVGVSDSHGLFTMLGVARTLVQTPDDVVAPDLDLQPVWDSLLAGRATVVVGPFVEIWATDDASQLVGMGGLATRQQGLVGLRVRIQAAPFVQTSRLIIVANGQPVYTMDLPDPGDPPTPLRYDEIIALDWTGPDAWFVAVVEGDAPMVPLTDKIPRSVTNPVYVDRNGDGQWTPPGL
ncbi:MAG: CehA/McbA family metallohydrolase [bacterium]